MSSASASMTVHSDLGASKIALTRFTIDMGIFSLCFGGSGPQENQSDPNAWTARRRAAIRCSSLSRCAHKRSYVHSRYVGLDSLPLRTSLQGSLHVNDCFCSFTDTLEPQFRDPRRRLRELLAIPDRERTDALRDEIVTLQLDAD